VRQALAAYGCVPLRQHASSHWRGSQRHAGVSRLLQATLDGVHPLPSGVILAHATIPLPLLDGLDSSQGCRRGHPSARPGRSASPWTDATVSVRRYVTLWISLSATVILYNKFILTWGNFPYPVALTMWHMFFCSVMAAGIIRAGYVEPVGMSTETYLRCVIQIDSASLLTWNDVNEDAVGPRMSAYCARSITIGKSEGCRTCEDHMHSLRSTRRPLMQHSTVASDVACLRVRRTIVPIGLLYSGTLWLGNAAYLYLSVSFIQMLKVCRLQQPMTCLKSARAGYECDYHD